MQQPPQQPVYFAQPQQSNAGLVVIGVILMLTGLPLFIFALCTTPFAHVFGGFLFILSILFIIAGVVLILRR